MRNNCGRQDPVGLLREGSSLVEVVIALAIIATCFVALLGILPAGLNASREAANSTTVAMIFEEVHNRLQSHPLKPGVVEFVPLDKHGRSPLYFDDRGVLIPSEAQDTELARRLYRADVRVAEWHQRPADAHGLMAVIVDLSWPVDAKTGEILGKNKTSVTYGVTALTGPQWTRIYPPRMPEWQYQEKIEF